MILFSPYFCRASGLFFHHFHLESDEKNKSKQSCKSCLPRLSRAIHGGDSVAYFTGVGSADRTGVCPACPVAPEDGTGV